MIRDKQELKRCVKQAVRKAAVIETDFSFDVETGSMGVSELLMTWAAPTGSPNDALRRAVSSGTPFCEEAAAMFSALSALELPTHNLNNAQTIQESYDRSAYLREILDAMRARRVLVRIPVNRAAAVAFDDDRFAPMISLDEESFFRPGRYGVSFEEKALELTQLLSQSNARDILCHRVSFTALQYCLIPVSEDTGCVLHLHAQCGADIDSMLALLESHHDARAVITASAAFERQLIDRAANTPNALVSLVSLDHLHYALTKLNTRFIPYTACSSLPEQMLGRWETARERLWQVLLDAYLPLARAGYELTSEAIAQDVSHLLGGNFDAFYRDKI